VKIRGRSPVRVRWLAKTSGVARPSELGSVARAVSFPDMLRGNRGRSPVRVRWLAQMSEVCSPRRAGWLTRMSGVARLSELGPVHGLRSLACQSKVARPNE
jgi:hypothetical protein